MIEKWLIKSLVFVMPRFRIASAVPCRLMWGQPTPCSSANSQNVYCPVQSERIFRVSKLKPKQTLLNSFLQKFWLFIMLSATFLIDLIHSILKFILVLLFFVYWVTFIYIFIIYIYVMINELGKRKRKMKKKRIYSSNDLTAFVTIIQE